MHWFAKDNVQIPNKLDELSAKLPMPIFEGYQARSMHKQGMFEPTARGWYIGTTMTTSFETITLKISARAVLDCLAGRITAEQFKLFVLDREKNWFDWWLNCGYTTDDVQIEQCGLDEDDDCMIFKFKFDPGAAPLKLKKSSKVCKA